MTLTTDLLRREIKRLQAVLCDPSGKACILDSPSELREVDEAFASLLALADQMERAEPVGAMYRHEKTGRTAFVDIDRADVFDHEKLRWSYIGELYLHPAPEVTRDAERRLRALRELCGYVEDSSNQTVHIYQDDATNSWGISIGNDVPRKHRWYARSFEGVIDAAMQEPKP